MNNWYRVLRPFDDAVANSTMLLEGNLRQLELERMGFLELLGPEILPYVAPVEDVAPKRGRRGKSVEAGPPEVEPVDEVPGDNVRGADGAAD